MGEVDVVTDLRERVEAAGLKGRGPLLEIVDDDGITTEEDEERFLKFTTAMQGGRESLKKFSWC